MGRLNKQCQAWPVVHCDNRIISNKFRPDRRDRARKKNSRSYVKRSSALDKQPRLSFSSDERFTRVNTRCNREDRARTEIIETLTIDGTSRRSSDSSHAASLINFYINPTRRVFVRAFVSPSLCFVARSFPNPIRFNISVNINIFRVTVMISEENDVFSFSFFFFFFSLINNRRRCLRKQRARRRFHGAFGVSSNRVGGALTTSEHAPFTEILDIPRVEFLTLLNPPELIRGRQGNPCKQGRCNISLFSPRPWLQSEANIIFPHRRRIRHENSWRDYFRGGAI